MSIYAPHYAYQLPTQKELAARWDQLTATYNKQGSVVDSARARESKALSKALRFDVCLGIAIGAPAGLAGYLAIDRMAQGTSSAKGKDIVLAGLCAVIGATVGILTLALAHPTSKASRQAHADVEAARNDQATTAGFELYEVNTQLGLVGEQKYIPGLADKILKAYDKNGDDVLNFPTNYNDKGSEILRNNDAVKPGFKPSQVKLNFMQDFNLDHVIERNEIIKSLWEADAHVVQNREYQLDGSFSAPGQAYRTLASVESNQ